MIEFKLIYNEKKFDNKNNNKINSLVNIFCKNAVNKNGDKYININEYMKDVDLTWKDLSENIALLAQNKKILAYDSFNDREYYIFQNDSITNLHESLELIIIVISKYNDLKENINIVLDRLDKIKTKNMTFEMSYNTRGKVYIYNSLKDDIKDTNFCLEISFEKYKLLKEVSFDLYKWLFIAVVLLVSYLVYKNQMAQCYNELTTATEETIKLFTNTKIAIIVNLITGLAGACFIELLILLIKLGIAFLNTKKIGNFSIIIKPEFVATSFEEYACKGTFESIAEGIEEEIPDIDENILNGVR